jgi:hypothetical protein
MGASSQSHGVYFALVLTKETNWWNDYYDVLAIRIASGEVLWDTTILVSTPLSDPDLYVQNDSLYFSIFAVHLQIGNFSNGGDGYSFFTAALRASDGLPLSLVSNSPEEIQDKSSQGGYILSGGNSVYWAWGLRGEGFNVTLLMWRESLVTGEFSPLPSPI